MLFIVIAIVYLYIVSIQYQYKYCINTIFSKATIFNLVADLDHVKRVNSHGQFYVYKFMTISFGVSNESLNTIYFTIKIPLVS